MSFKEEDLSWLEFLVVRWLLVFLHKWAYFTHVDKMESTILFYIFTAIKRTTIISYLLKITQKMFETMFTSKLGPTWSLVLVDVERACRNKLTYTRKESKRIKSVQSHCLRWYSVVMLSLDKITSLTISFPFMMT